MKKTALILTVAIVALLASYSFSTIDKYPDYVSSDSIALFKAQYLKTINNNDLNHQLEQNFSNLFDKVTAVDGQFSHETGYYYIVFGEKNNEKSIQLLKIEKEDLDNETYTYIDFTNIEVDEFTQYCWTGGINCPPGCTYTTAPCWAICGVGPTCD